MPAPRYWIVRLQTVTLLLPHAVSGLVLEDYNIRGGADPTGGSYLYWNSGTRFFSNAAEALGLGTYEEKDWNGDRDEEISVSVAAGGRVAIFQYYNDTVRGPAEDPFYSLQAGMPQFSFTYHNPSASAVLVSLAVEISGSRMVPLPGTTWQLASGQVGEYSINLATNSKFAELVDGWSGGALRFTLIQETPDGIPSTVEYDDFRLMEAVSVPREPTPLDISPDEWTKTDQLGWLHGEQQDIAWSPSLGWLSHKYFPWIYQDVLGWVYCSETEDDEDWYLFSPAEGHFFHSPQSRFWAYRFRLGDWQNLVTGEHFFQGSTWLRSVATGQPDDVPGNWSLSFQPKPALAEILGRPDPEVPVYGLYCWAGEYIAHREFINTMGWRQFRLSGPINDEVVRAYSEDGARVMFTIAARDPFTSEWRNAASFDTLEDFIADFLEDITRVLDRYGPEGTFWQQNPGLTHKPIEAIEIFNEPNFWYLNMTKAEYDAGEETPELKEERIGIYAQLLPAAYAHIKENWPSITVVGFGGGGAASADVGFISAVHGTPTFSMPAYDVLSTHPYVRPVPPEANSIRAWGNYSITRNHQTIRSVMAASGAANKPVWWTELGWSVEDGFFANDGEGTIPRSLQAAYYIRSYARALRLGVERLTFMSIVDTDSVNFGLLDRNGTLRPSAHAVQNMISLMPHPRLLATVLETSDDSVCAYTFDPDVNDPGDFPITMAWSVRNDNARLELLWDVTATGALTINADQLELIDMAGNATLHRREDGPLAIQLGPYPVYIRPVDGF